MKRNECNNDDLFWCALTLVACFFCCLLAHSTPAKADESPQIVRIIQESAARHGVDPALAVAIAKVESNLNPTVIGSLGEIGVFQLRPEYHRVLAGQTNDNIEVAMQYLANLQVQCADYGDAFFVCFNYGTARKLKYPRLFPYYKKVKQQMGQEIVLRTTGLRYQLASGR